MPNSFSNSTTGTDPSSNRGVRKSSAATAMTLGDLMSMDLEDLAATRLGELEGSEWIFRNGFNQKQPQGLSR